MSDKPSDYYKIIVVRSNKTDVRFFGVWPQADGTFKTCSWSRLKLDDVDRRRTLEGDEDFHHLHHGKRLHGFPSVDGYYVRRALAQFRGYCKSKGLNREWELRWSAKGVLLTASK